MRITLVTFVSLLLVSLNMQLNAQSCRVYEHEMEQYFSSHESGTPISFNLLNRIKNRCQEPTDKMKLIYNFFKAVDAFHSESYNDYEAYEATTHYYDICANYFSALSLNGEDKFSNLFFERAEGLEVSLATLAYDLGYERLNRYYGNSKLDDWRKESIASADTRGGNLSRSMGERKGNSEYEFRKTRSIERTSSGPSPEYGKNGEPLGFVGLLSDINPVSYLKWLRGTSSRSASPEPQENTGLLFSWEDDPNIEGQEMEPFSSSENLNARLAESVELINIGSSRLAQFGESVFKTDAEKTVFRDGKNYVQVFTRTGQSGWIEAEMLVPDGKLAVIINNTTGFPDTKPQNERSGIIFTSGELIVLEAYENKRVRVVGPNGWKRAWINNLANLSVEPIDIKVALALNQAMKTPSKTIRKRKLEDIVLIPGFRNSELAELVMRSLQANQ